MHAVPIWGLPVVPRTILAVVAHPDDESFGLGGLLGSFVDAGARGGVLCFTHGEASTLGSGDLFAVRERELAAATDALGLSWCRLLSHPDGRLDREPIQLLADEVSEAVNATGAELILAFDDSGVTGHPDHRAATEAAVVAARRLGLGVLAWTVTPAVAEKLNAEFGTSFTGRPGDLLVRVDRARQRRAIAAHRSQAVGNRVLERRLALSGNTEAVRWLVLPAPDTHHGGQPEAEGWVPRRPRSGPPS